MKYWKIIISSFIIGCLTVLAGLLILHSQSSPSMGHHIGNDMVNVAYGLAIGFNIVLALSSLPILLLKRCKAYKLWQAAALLFGLSLLFTIAVTWLMDYYALLYCLPYLCSVAILFVNRNVRQKNILHVNLKASDRTAVLRIRTHEYIGENFLRLHIYSSNKYCGSIDFITEKINFNIAGVYFFKGMEAIKNVELEYHEEKLIFTLRNKKWLSLDCRLDEFEAVKAHIQVYGKL